MYRPVTLAMVGRGHWGMVYTRTIRTLAMGATHGRPPIILPDALICGSNYATVLTEECLTRCDGVIVSATTRAHADIVAYLLARGVRNILLEKPVTATTAEADRLAALLETTPDALVMAGHTLLYDPAYRAMREAAPQRIGRITEATYTSVRAPHIAGDTIIPDAGSPPLYLFLDIAGALPTTIAARPLERDHVVLTLTFADGLRCVARIGTDAPERIRRVTMTGPRGTLTLDEFMDPRTLTHTGPEGTTTLTLPTGHTPLAHELLAFAECITATRTPRSTFTHGADVVRLIELAVASHAHGGATITVSASPHHRYAHPL